MRSPFFLTIRSLVFYVGYFAATVIISLICIIVFWLIPLHRRFFIYSLWCRFVLFWLRITCDIKYEIEGLENIPDTPVVVLSTHQSSWETIFLYYAISPVCPILKKELLNIPFWGWAMRLQQPIAIDRSKPREAGRSLLIQGKERLSKGLSVVIFPEGTRSPAGKIKAFSRGGAKLAINANAPVLPVIHNAGYCWPPRSFLKCPGVIHVRIGALISPENKTSAQLTDEFASWVQTHKAVLECKARP